MNRLLIAVVGIFALSSVLTTQQPFDVIFTNRKQANSDASTHAGGPLASCPSAAIMSSWLPAGSDVRRRRRKLNEHFDETSTTKLSASPPPPTSPTHRL